MKYTPENITHLKPNQIFCFGSNQAGIHGAGAARLALQKFGARYGKTGFVGQSYGISTKDKNIKTLPLSEIKKEIEQFVDFAKCNPQLEFLMTQIGCGLASFQPKYIAPLFRGLELSSNIIFPECFEPYLT